MSDRDSTKEKAELLWDEYKYRHELIWKLIFQITIAVTIISIIPYTKTEITARIGKIIVLLPVVGILLTLVGFIRLLKEMSLLKRVRTRHRQYQSELHRMVPIEETWSFEDSVIIYFVLMLLLEFLNVWIILSRGIHVVA